MKSEIRRFHLLRDKDVTGFSGTGLIAWGVQFPDGKVVTRWNGDIAQIGVWEDIEHVKAVHGHGGFTRIEWIDDDGWVEA